MLELNELLDTATLAQSYQRDRRIQIRDVLAESAATQLADMLRSATPWGLARQSDVLPPAWVRADKLAALTPEQRQKEEDSVLRTMEDRGYAFRYSAYPMVTAYLERWHPGSQHEKLLEALNSAPFIDFVRRVTGIAELVKGDAQATLYAPGQFLAQHDDSEQARGRRVAYVLNFTDADWRTDWGGYLNFFDEAGDIVVGYRPKFNTLSLFSVPQAHHVSYVPPFAPRSRYAITGWFRDQ